MRMLAGSPVLKFRHSYDATPITTAAWLELIASLEQPASAVEIFNGSGSIIKLSTGAAGIEDDSEIKYYILPGGSAVILPLGFGKTSRISAKAINADAAAGDLILNFFG